MEDYASPTLIDAFKSGNCPSVSLLVALNEFQRFHKYNSYAREVRQQQKENSTEDDGKEVERNEERNVPGLLTV